MAKPVYVFSGFLDSGKTTAIKDILSDRNFNEGEKNLIIALEQGDEEYDQEFCTDYKCDVVYYSGLSELTKEEMKKLDFIYKPDRIIVELNGMENDNDFYNMDLYKPWVIVQALTFFDGSNLRLYMNNMKQFVYNHVIHAEAIYINRCKREDVLFYRNNMKAINPRVQIVFMDENGDMINDIQQQLFDTSKPLKVEDEDYGLWYLDAIENPQRYDEKQITLKLQYVMAVPEYEDVCIMGRKAMVCCANDTQDAALTCVGVDPAKMKKDQYYYLSGIIHTLEDEEGYDTCVLYVGDVKEAEKPKEEFVSFS